MMTIAMGGLAILALCGRADSFYGLIYNASGSVPMGWYVANGRAAPRRGMLMLVVLPGPWRKWAAQRGYLPLNVMALKHISAGPGDTVCGRGDRVLLNGRLAALRFKRDSSGRPMPRWSGCIILDKRQWFLLNPAPSSLDSRYFGPVLGTAMQGRAVPL
jgi:conjugative transfer signal peptidase TraF